MDSHALLRIASRIAAPVIEDDLPLETPIKKSHHDLVKVMKDWAKQNESLKEKDSKGYVKKMEEELKKHGWDRADYIKAFKTSPRSVLEVVDPETKKMLLKASTRSKVSSVRIASGLLGAGFFHREAAAMLDEIRALLAEFDAAPSSEHDSYMDEQDLAFRLQHIIEDNVEKMEYEKLRNEPELRSVDFVGFKTYLLNHFNFVVNFSLMDWIR